MTSELARRCSKEILTVAMLDQLEGRAPAVIEVNNRHTGTCNSYLADGTCRATSYWGTDSQRTVCTNCPVWSGFDVLYENITGREIEQTYDWWRNEWIEHGIPYAKERMTDHTPEKEPVIVATTCAKPMPVYVWIWRKPLSWDIDRQVSGIVIGIVFVVILFNLILRLK